MSEAVTVFIPNYNGEQFLGQVFESLKAQTFQNFRCVFLDDGSTDGSVDVARRFASLLPNLEIHEFENVGLAGNWNRALALVKTEYFTLLHCDDSYEPDYLRGMLALMARYPSAALGHCSARTMDANGKLVFSPVEHYKRAVFLPSGAFCRDRRTEFQALLKADFINCPSVMYRTSAVHEVGPFDTSLRQTLDWDYWFRVVLAGYQICGTRQNLYRYRRHTGNMTVQNSKDFDRYEEELRTLEWAQAEGLKAGLVTEPLNLAGVRRIVIVDIGHALAAGELAWAGRKLGFLQDRLSGGRGWTRLLKVVMSLGRPGGVVLLAIIDSAVFLLMLWSSLLRFGRQTQTLDN